MKKKLSNYHSSSFTKCPDCGNYYGCSYEDHKKVCEPTGHDPDFGR